MERKKAAGILTVLSIVYLSCLATIGAASAWQPTLRCGSDLASVGDSKAIVEMRCGKPYRIDSEGTKTAGGFQTGRTTPVPGQTFGGGTYQQETVSIETWYYNCGTTSFIYALRFEGSTLQSIESIGRGSGNNECLPR